MPSERLVIYVTLLPDSQTVEFYGVQDSASGHCDLRFEGCSHSSKVPLAMFDEFTAWLWEKTAGGSPSTNRSSSTV